MRSILLTAAAVFGLIVSSCINDDITGSPAATLQFSADTVSFGTVFTDIPTPTARLLVYNRNKKGVRVSSIRFASPSSAFSLNVDGQSGASFRDVEIRGRDSIYVFIECLVGADGEASPRKVSDRLQFVTNGVTQEVEVTATAQNVARLRNVRVDGEMTLTPRIPYLVFDSLTVGKGGVLNIEPGTTLLFHDGASLVVEGTLNAVGTSGRRIEMRGDRIDDVLPGIGYDILAGQWKGIRIGAGSFGNRMEYVDMRSTESGLRVDSCGDVSRPKLTLVNSWLHNSQADVLSSTDAKVDAYGCCFSESPKAVVRLTGGDHRFVQCTIANNYLFSAVTEANLSLFSTDRMKASFENCIIWGIGAPLSPGKLDGTSVYIRDTLLKADGSDDDNFTGCVWNEDPLFLTVRADYYFNYHVEPGSPAVGKGNPAWLTPECLADMDGAPRLSAPGSPTVLGAYARTESPSEETN